MATSRLPNYLDSTNNNTGGSSSNWASKAGLALAGGAAVIPFLQDQPAFNNPANAAKPYLDQVPGAVSPYLQPYINQGQQAGGQLQSQFGQAINDPGALSAKLGAGYKQSPGYQFKLHQSLMAGDNAAAAGGMAGTPAHQQTQMQLANDIASQDFNDYMSRILGVYNKGLEGEQGFQTQGFGASKDLGETIGNSLLNQGKLAYMGAAQQNEANQAQAKSTADMWGNLAGTAAQALPYLAAL